jgi:hypothetical protein
MRGTRNDNRRIILGKKKDFDSSTENVAFDKEMMVQAKTF